MLGRIVGEETEPPDTSLESSDKPVEKFLGRLASSIIQTDPLVEAPPEPPPQEVSENATWDPFTYVSSVLTSCFDGSHGAPGPEPEGATSPSPGGMGEEKPDGTTPAR